MPPWLYHLNYTSLNKMIKDKLVNEPDKIIIPWRSTKERLTSCYRDAFCREGHHFSEWTKEVRLTNSISTFMRSNKLSKGVMPHFSPVFEEKPKKEVFVYEWKQSDKFVKDMTRCRLRSWHAMSIDNFYTRHPSVNSDFKGKIFSERTSKVANEKTAYISASTIDTFELPEIFKYDQIIDEKIKQLSICSENAFRWTDISTLSLSQLKT